MPNKQTDIKSFMEWCETDQPVQDAARNGHTLLDIHPERESIRKRRCQAAAAMSHPSTSVQPNLESQPSNSGEIVVGEPVVLNFDGCGGDISS